MPKSRCFRRVARFLAGAVSLPPGTRGLKTQVSGTQFGAAACVMAVLPVQIRGLMQSRFNSRTKTLNLVPEDELTAGRGNSIADMLGRRLKQSQAVRAAGGNTAYSAQDSAVGDPYRTGREMYQRSWSEGNPR